MSMILILQMLETFGVTCYAKNNAKMIVCVCATK